MPTQAPERVKLWEANPGPQTEFLQASEEEVLYGGAAGGGKTDGMVIDALGLWQDAIRKPTYRSLILRRTLPELSQLIDRSRALYPSIVPGATYNEQKKEWAFPSGAKLRFGYAEQESDRFQYQGQEYQYIGFEELTQWSTPVIYEYLWSRLRTSDPTIKCLVRSTTNPGGVGNKWVKERFGISDSGMPSRQTTSVRIPLEDGTEVVMRIRRRFIPARLSDNPFLGHEYRAQLMQMPEMDRKALLDGRWDVIDIPGAIFKAEIERCFADGRLCQVPVDATVPVHTVWDLGMDDSMSIWFIQRAGAELHFVDFYQHRDAGFDHYAKVLQQKNYFYGTNVAPHDIMVKEMGSGMTRLESAEKLGIRFQVAPRLSLVDGLNAARLTFQDCWFDVTRCSEGFEALKNYRREYAERLGEFKPEPVHDWASHPSDAFRYACVSKHMLVDSAGPDFINF